MSSSPVPDDDLTEALLITRQFNSPEEFSHHIESEAVRRDIRLMESLLEYCEDHDVDPVAAASLITSELKAKVQVEADGLNLLVRKKK